MMMGGASAIGFAPIGMRLSEFGPQATAFWRFSFALPILATLVYAFGGRIGRPSPMGLVAGVFFGLDIAFWHAALEYTSVAQATFLVNLGNVSVGLLAWLVLKERPSRLWPAAAMIAVCGALLLSLGGDGRAGSLRGDALALIAAVMVSLYLLFAKIARRQESALNVLFWATVAEATVAAIATAGSGESFLPESPVWFLAPLGLAVIAQSIGQTLIVGGVGRTPAALAGVLMLLQPVMGSLIAWPLFGETLTVPQILGAGLILIGVWLAGSGTRPPVSAPESPKADRT
ncbi:MAG: EamA family transporter [Alphaproteobacteria bacterium]|nr:EamA family transporter [Alphaproteobacteria bacterium]